MDKPNDIRPEDWSVLDHFTNNGRGSRTHKPSRVVLERVVRALMRNVVGILAVWLMMWACKAPLGWFWPEWWRLVIWAVCMVVVNRTLMRPNAAGELQPPPNNQK